MLLPLSQQEQRGDLPVVPLKNYRQPHYSSYDRFRGRGLVRFIAY